MTNIKESLKNLIREELAGKSGSSNPSAYRTGHVSIQNSDGTLGVLLDGALVTASSQYQVVPGQEVVLAFSQSGGISAIPTRPVTRPLDLRHGDFLTSGDAGPLRAVAQTFFNGVVGLIFQQQKDSHYYFLSDPAGRACFDPFAFSPDGSLVACVISDFGVISIQVFKIGTSAFTGSATAVPLLSTMSGVTVVGNSVTWDGSAFASSIIGPLSPTPPTYSTQVMALSVDNDGTCYVAFLFGGVSKQGVGVTFIETKGYEGFYEIAPGFGSALVQKGLTFSNHSQETIGPNTFFAEGDNYHSSGILDGKKQASAGAYDSTNGGGSLVTDAVALFHDNTTNGLNSSPTAYFNHNPGTAGSGFSRVFRAGSKATFPFVNGSGAVQGAWLADLAGTTIDEYTFNILNPGDGGRCVVQALSLFGGKPLARIQLPFDSVFGSQQGLWARVTAVDRIGKVITIDCAQKEIIDKTSTATTEKYDFFPGSRIPPNTDTTKTQYGIVGVPLNV